MLTCIYLQKYYTSEYYTALCHNGSDTPAHMPMLSMTASTNMPLRAQSTMTSEAATSNLHSLLAKLYLSSMMPGTCGSLSPSSAKPIIAPTWVQVIGGGQYRCASDHIQEHHPDAVQPDTSNIGDVAPAASTSAPATQIVRLSMAVAPTTPIPAAPEATLQTPHKAAPAIHSPH